MSKIVIRAAQFKDIPDLIELSVESVSQDPLPVTISRAAIRQKLEQCIGKAAHFAWVSTVEGKVVGGVVAETGYGFWFERQQCSVLLYFTRVAGGCVPLLRRLAEWVKGRPAIKLAVVELEPGCDPRLVRFFASLGFARQSTNMAFVRSRA